jgi:thiol-disulfide isomerase/thioredoxin
VRTEATHVEDCPDIGPICALRAEPPQLHHTTMWISELRLLAEYGLLDWLAVQLMFPVRLVDTWTRYTNLAGAPLNLDYVNIHHHDEVLFGPGDPQLLAHFGVRLGPASVGARVGVSLPLGVVHENPYRLAAMGLPHEHLQFGTGTFDPLVGLDAAVPMGRATVSAFGLTQVPLYTGRQGYQAGARLFGGLAVSAPFGDSEVMLRATALGVNEWPERWDGVVPTEDGNQGRSDVYLGAGVTLPFSDDWSVSIDLRGRMWGYAKNAQLDLPLVLDVSVGRLFHFESEPQQDDGPTADDVEDVVAHGELAPLDAVSGRWVVFDFWAPWCEACGVLDGRLRALVREREGLALRRVNIVDFDSPIARRELNGVTSLPHVRLVDPSGRRVLELSGTVDEVFAAVRRALDPR